MTSLIFGTLYMTHQGIVEHRRAKKRQKNYERWEDLRDEYDAQKKTQRESRSLDIQRTGSWEPPQAGYGGGYTAREERPILTLRDQQEANDARLSWRPQESWEASHRSSTGSLARSSTSSIEAMVPQRTASVPAIPPHLQAQPTAQYQPSPQQQQHPPLPHASTTPSAYWQSRGELKPQKTGVNWDDGLPAPLQVTRRSFEDYQYPHLRRGSAPVQQEAMQNSPSRSNSQRQSRNVSAVPSRTATPVSIQSRVVPGSVDDLSAKLANIRVDAVESHVPGGRMAELIERGY